MAGPKEIRTQLEKANRKMEKSLAVSRPATTFVKGKKSGRSTFVIGTTQGTLSPMEPVSDATIEVDSVDIVGNTCNPL